MIKVNFIRLVVIQWLNKSLNEVQKSSLVPRTVLAQPMPIPSAPKPVGAFNPTYGTIDQVYLHVINRLI